MTATESGREAVSIVCVFNEPDVLDSTLRRSIDAGLGDAPRTEFIPVDNRGGEFATAGAALNHGARQAVNPVIVFVHQDVFLHSLVELERAARDLLADPAIGVMGAAGVDARRHAQGRIRDRIVGLGVPAPRPRDVESMDEVLFMLPRAQWLQEPLADEAGLGWHAYAVEYSARMRSRGRRAVVRDIPLTHNSLSTNLRHLDVARRWVADAYPELLPLQTTCGAIERVDSSRGFAGLGRRVRSLARWERESRVATTVRDTVRTGDVILADIRFSIDELATAVDALEICAADLADSTGEATAVEGLSRWGRRFSAATLDVAGMNDLLRGSSIGQLVVLTNLTPAALAELSLADADHIVGYSQEAGIWVAVGAGRTAAEVVWPSRRSKPYAGVLRTTAAAAS